MEAAIEGHAQVSTIHSEFRIPHSEFFYSVTLA